MDFALSLVVALAVLLGLIRIVYHCGEASIAFDGGRNRQMIPGPFRWSMVLLFWVTLTVGAGWLWITLQ